ncbi:FG-GAP repeat protein [Planctomycetes bacterium Pla163]|uniref:FG-GAP repeat protein n=1 Tax=Rohdeia mirabilis TaxID=2528008 RepID=A0A518CXF0_9BACT|nr:FG-GAP repeat protein [Planctomycetes bacterium Pla163]
MNSTTRTAVLTASIFSLFPLAAQAQISFDARGAVPAGPAAQDSAFADLDGDGIVDLAVTVDAPDRIVILRGDGNGAFTFAGSILTGGGSSPQALVAADLDGDGDADLAVSLKNNSAVASYRNDGGLSFAALGSVGVGDEPRHMGVADLDGDGDLDLATSNRDGNSVTVLRNAGAGTFTAQSVAVGADPRSLAFADLDGDGDTDIAVASSDDRRLDLLTNTGGTFALTSSLSTGAQFRPDGLVAGDVDGDGDVDLVAAGDANNVPQLLVFQQNAGVFGPQSVFAVGGQNPSYSVAGDFDLDGDLDVAVLCTDSSVVALMANDGAGNFVSESTLPVGSDPQHVAIGDLDGNGGADLAVTDDPSGTVSVFTNQARCGAFAYGLGLGGATTAQIGLSGVPALGSEVQFVMSGFAGNAAALFAFSAAPAELGGFLGGTLLVDPSSLGPISLVQVTGGTGSLGLLVPSDPSFLGLTLFAQGAAFDGGGPEGWTLTHGLEVVTCP